MSQPQPYGFHLIKNTQLLFLQNRPISLYKHRQFFYLTIFKEDLLVGMTLFTQDDLDLTLMASPKIKSFVNSVRRKFKKTLQQTASTSLVFYRFVDLFHNYSSLVDL